jgi:hypothetical protein
MPSEELKRTFDDITEDLSLFTEKKCDSSGIRGDARIVLSQLTSGSDKAPGICVKLAHEKVWGSDYYTIEPENG